jgi:N-acetylglucosaminyldiphosphoundecaprenol N-acetyl-beta-D-mannosaminyltransferase
MAVLPENSQRKREKVITTWIDCIDWAEATNLVLGWARVRAHKFVTICNVHSVVTARSDLGLREAINCSDLATPDGMPVAWLIGRRRSAVQSRVNGPDFTLRLCEMAERESIVVSFYGSQTATLRMLRSELLLRFPSLQIGVMISPPFRALSVSEVDEYRHQLNDTRSGIVFVGLGCPKQERWMLENSSHIGGVLIGVGAAFDYIAGTVRRPPRWMQEAGLEWLGRLLAEPKRLWRRYLVTNTVYISYVIAELLGFRGPKNK